MKHRQPEASSSAALQRMKRQRQRDTKAELTIRRLLHGRGMRYRVHSALPMDGVRRTVDILFPRARVAVFIDGCYWHACPVHGTRPKANSEWWAQKLDSNVARDRDTDRRLVAGAWTVVRIWEHEDPEAAANRVQQAVLGLDADRPSD